MYKKYKFYLGITLITIGVLSIFQGAFLGGLILAIVGAASIPKLSKKLKEQFTFWEKRPVRVIISLILIMIGIGFASSKWEFLESDTMSNYSIYKEEVSSNTSNSKKVIMNVILEDKTSNEEDIRKLLTYLYKEKSNQFSEPITIGIKLYQSEEHVQSGMGQWIGMLHKNYKEESPTISIQKQYIASKKKQNQDKFDLSKSQRKEIWNNIIKAQDRAESDAEDKYPMNSDHPNYWNGNTFLEDKFKDISYKHIDYSKMLMKKYELEVCSRFNISEAIADSITSEGMKENWAFPK